MSTTTRVHNNFPLLADIERQVVLKLDQPSDEAGQLTWVLPDEFVHAANNEYKYLWGRMASMGFPFRPVDDPSSVAIIAGTRTYSLPSACRQLRKVMEVDANGNELGELAFATDDDMGKRVMDSIVYRPDLQQLVFTSDPGRSFLVRLTYMAFPLPLGHGVARGGSVNSLRVGAHETYDNGAFVGQTVYAYKGQGASQSAVATGYDGNTQTITITWEAIDNGSGPQYPGAGTAYTMRPLLPPDMEDAFVYGICSRMVEKNDDERYLQFTGRREIHLDRVQQDLGRRNLMGPSLTRDDSGLSSVDPYWTGV